MAKLSEISGKFFDLMDSGLTSVETIHRTIAGKVFDESSVVNEQIHNVYDVIHTANYNISEIPTSDKHRQPFLKIAEY